MRQFASVTFAAVVFSVSAHAQQLHGEWKELNDPLPNDEYPSHGVWLPPTTIGSDTFAHGLILYFRRTNVLARAPFLWDPNPAVRKTVMQTPSPVNEQSEPVNLACCGHSIDARGRAVFSGGRHDDFPGCGVHEVFVYDPHTNDMERIGDMAEARWYPTCLTNEDGQIWMFAGQQLPYTGDPPSCIPNRRVEFYDPLDTQQPIHMPVLDIGLDPPWYPMMHLLGSEDAEDGEMVIVGPIGRAFFFDTVSGTLTPGEWTQLSIANQQLTRRNASSSVVYVDLRDPEDIIEKVLLAGGYTDGEDDPTDTSEILEYDPVEEEWAWRWTGDQTQTKLTEARAHGNLVQLLCGDSAYMGGARIGLRGCPVYKTEIFDYETETWTVSDSNEYPRAYHAIAGVVRDGSVFMAGQDKGSYCPDPNCSTCMIPIPHGGDIVEMYEPWYVGDQYRPQILDVDPPGNHPDFPLERGETFDVEFWTNESGGREFKWVALVALCSKTHSVEMQQRYVILKHDPPIDNEVVVEVPPARFAPPGPYMLVVVDEDNQGRRSASIAEFVYLGYEP